MKEVLAAALQCHNVIVIFVVFKAYDACFVRVMHQILTKSLDSIEEAVPSFSVLASYPTVSNLIKIDIFKSYIIFFSAHLDGSTKHIIEPSNDRG